MKYIKIILLTCVIVCFCGCQKDANLEKLTVGSNGPYSFNEVIYFRTDAVVFERKNKSTEYIRVGMEQRLYYDRESTKKDILIGDEDFMRVYADENVVEGKEYIDGILNKFQDYVLIKEAAEKEYGSKGALYRKKYQIEEKSVKELENTFGKVAYNIKDIKNADEIYILEAGSQNQQSFNKKYFEDTGYSVGDYWNTEMPHFYVGMIIVKDNEVYYGNLENQIGGDLKTIILETLNK